MHKIENIINRIHHADCLPFMREMPDNCVDLVLTDIPYGEVNRDSNGLRNLDKKDADIVNFSIVELTRELLRICNGSLYIFCGWIQLSTIKILMEYYGLSTRIIIWEKTNPSPMNGEYIWLSGIEPAIYGKKPNATHNRFCQNTVLKFKSDSQSIKKYNMHHPTIKSVKLFKDLTLTSSNKNDIVFDPFLGSGTTAVACAELDRQFIGVEISQDYCDIAQKRVDAVMNQTKLNLETE